MPASIYSVPESVSGTWERIFRGIGVMDINPGQHIKSKRDGCIYQVRRIKFQNGEQLLGIGRKEMCWVFAKDFKKLGKVK
ncbi:hypothetical protein [Acinetobacter sp. YH12090]|uniref:hypothetical protein n=1 Tax=Acinetobacter sp. YH12090 TaxID=2601081 RepID=UPI0015D1D04A|nr:hypothetical protein [Acinetobacter sp. YH12090]